MRRLFDRIDTSRNGKLEYEEVQYALEHSGIVINPSMLRAFFDTVDTNHDGVIEFTEWRNFLLLVPLDRVSIQNIFSYYQEHSQITSEGDALVSYSTTRSLGYFTAGGIAGAISRTTTAPFDRLKTYLIANTGGSKGKVDGSIWEGKHPLKHVEKGEIGKAIKKAGSPLMEAARSIYRAGGIRSFFVGKQPSGVLKLTVREWIECAQSVSRKCHQIWVNPLIDRPHVIVPTRHPNGLSPNLKELMI